MKLLPSFVRRLFWRKGLQVKNCEAELLQAVEKVRAGQWRFRFQEEKVRPLPFCLSFFNWLMDRLEPLLVEMAGQRDDLETILSEIEEAVAITDSRGKLLWANRLFRELFEPLFFEDRYIWEIIRSSTFQELFANFQAGKKERTAEIYQAERPYLVNLLSLNEKDRDEAKRGKIALILSERSAEKNLEMVKKDLVANISHELRTPLTMIKGYLDTLEEESLAAAARSYVSIIKNNVERLERIVRDLLTLAELESRKSLAEREKVSLADIVARVVEQFKAYAQKKNLFLRAEMPTELPMVLGDSWRLEQMLVNLVDNAIKYTERGGVTIKLEKAENDLIIKIEDTGIGIAAEHLGRIFERFYVVDKHRSRQQGGTGLGLSIVKHIVLLHGGKISVESRQGVGTTFKVSLPLACT